MILNVLTVGDVVGEQGLDFLTRHLRALQKLHDIHFTVVNGENASGVGILPRQAQDIFDAGGVLPVDHGEVDVVEALDLAQVL